MNLRFAQTMFRSAVLLSALLSLLLESGCATFPRLPAAETRERLGAVAIVPARYVPESNFVSFAKGRAAGASAGAVNSAVPVIVVGAPAAVLTGGIAGGIIAVLTVSYSGLAAAAGAVAGAMEVVPPEKSREIEQAIADAVIRLDAQQTLARNLLLAAEKEPIVLIHAPAASGPASPKVRPSYRELGTDGIDTVLEISITEIGFETCPQSSFSCRGKDQLIGMFVKARARLVRTRDGAELYARTFWHESRPLKFEDWAANGGQPLAEAFEFGWRDLASRIVDELFLITPVRLPASSIFATRGNPYQGRCWLRPVYPSPGPEVDSRQPLLRWESFPRALDRERVKPAVLEGIRDVTYDLKIWDMDDGVPVRLVYERYGLAEPSHRVETALAAGREYAWSFRARFVLGGLPMATRWASKNFSGSWEFGPRDESGGHSLTVCQSDQIMPWLYYHLVTPKD